MNLVRMEVSFWRHKSKKKGYAQIYCRISVNGERQDIGSTGITIWYNDWDATSERVLDNDPHSHFKNEQLLILKSHLSAIFNDLFRKKEKITAGKIKRLHLNGQQSLSMTSIFDLYIKDCKEDRERNLNGSSVTVYNNVRKKVIDFLIAKKALDLPAEDFDLAWLKKYRSWMAQVQVNATQKGHSDSYISKHSQTIKNVLTWARLKKLIDTNPLEGHRVKGAEYGDPVFLTPEQFGQLSRHKFKNSKLQQTADIMVILCRTGYHYGDLEDFVKEHKTALQQGIDGKPWLIKKRIKTKVAARVPQFNEVKQIVEKYGGWEHLPIRPLSKFNDLLKLVAAALDLPPELSSKAGCKTFTDWCFNELHLTTDAVMVLLGRKSSKGLEVYGRPDERRVIHELEKTSIKK